MCVVHLTPTVSQCTTKYCSDDDNDNDFGVLTAMVSHLKNTEERLEQQHQQCLDSLEELEKQHQDSIEQLQQQFNDSSKQQQEYVIKLENTLKEKMATLEQGVIFICLTGSRLVYPIWSYRSIYLHFTIK